MKIFKVRFLDILGKEVAEFGFYESRVDAMKRWDEIIQTIKSPGYMDIREITVIPDSEKMTQEDYQRKQEKELKDHYDFK